MSKPLIYIAGSITGIEDFKARFEQAKVEVAQLGYEPVSPCDVTKPFPDTGAKEIWLACMKLDIPALLNCDGIYLLRGWENSRGARLEKLIADGLDMLVLYQAEDPAAAAKADAYPANLRLAEDDDEYTNERYD
jgi:hypothetical protein